MRVVKQILRVEFEGGRQTDRQTAAYAVSTNDQSARIKLREPSLDC